MKTPQITGLETVMKNLNKEIKAIENRSMAGMITGAIIIRRATEKESPKTPVEFGNLRSSFFVVTSDGSRTPGGAPSFVGDNAGEMASEHEKVKSVVSESLPKRIPAVGYGFSANYAMMVHEKVDAKFKRPRAGAKFLETAIKNNTAAVLEAIAGAAQIK